MKKTSSARYQLVTFASIIAFMLAASGLAIAQVKQGDTIKQDNANQVKDLVSPGVFYKVQHGMSMQITAPEKIEWPPPYREATEKYSQQVRLSPDHRSLLGYVAGQPFPFIDANDPEVATKVMWNNVFRPITTDDYDLRFFDCDSENNKPGASFNPITYFQVGHYAGYDLIGRTEVQPVPVDPDFKQTGRMWLFALYPILAPQDIRGSGFIRYRYFDENKGDDQWSWTPGTRRVRRLNESMMSSAVASGPDVTTWDPDHYSGFNAKTEEYDYKFLGEKDMLASVHAEHSPEQRCMTDGGASACPENWEMRHMYVIQATPRHDKIPGALQSKTLIFMDSELAYNPYIDTYDRKGQLWQNHIYWLTYRDRPAPDAKVAIYPFKRQFVVGAASTDTQSGMTTMCYLPGHETPEREAWYINMGAVDKSFFTTESMAKSAP